ncbi:MAG: tetratricopeptide repeat protein, partial [Bacteroidota bacterium]
IRSDVFQLGKVLELLLNGTKSDEDLWAISQYATREEKEDRYANVSELGEDINNYLTHKPISAKKSSGSYVLRKFISRHKTAVSLSSLLFVIIVLFTGLYIQQIGKERKQTENALIKAQNESQRAITALKKADEAAHRAQEASLKADSARKLAESRSESLVRANNLVRLEKERSEDEAAKSKAILGFVNSLFSEGHPNTSQGDTLSIFEIMERGEQNLSESDYRLDIKTEILRNTAKIYKAWNDNPRAHALYKQIKEYDKELYGESSERYFSSFFALAETSHNDHMVAHYQELLAELRRYGKPDKETYILTLLRMAEKYFYSNRYDKYEELFAKARLEFDLIKDESKEFAIWQTLAKYWSWGKDEKAEYCYQKAYQLIIDRYGTSSFQYAHCLHEHASYLGHMGHFNKAISQYKEALNITRNLYGDISYPIGFCYNGLGIVYQQKGELDSAAHNFKKATEIHEMLLGSENLQTLIAQKNWATMYYKSGQYEKAIPVLRQSVDDFVKYVPSFFQSIVKARYFLAESLKETGNWKEAEDLYRLNIKNILNYAEEHVTTPGIKTWEIINEGGVCEVLYGKGKINKSFQSFDTTLIMAKKHIPNHPFIPYHEVNYATRIAKEFQLYDSARNMIYRAEKNFETHHPGRINDIQKAKLRRGYCLWKLGEFEEGYSLIADCYNYFTPTNRPDLKNEARGYLDQMQEMVSIQSAISQVKGN